MRCGELARGVVGPGGAIRGLWLVVSPAIHTGGHGCNLGEPNQVTSKHVRVYEFDNDDPKKKHINYTAVHSMSQIAAVLNKLPWRHPCPRQAAELVIAWV